MKHPLLATLLVALCGACGGSETSDATSRAGHGGQPAEAERVVIAAADAAAFGALPAHYHGDSVPAEELVDLGRMLYYEPRLSSDNSVSCNSCHALDRWGVDGEATSPGVGGQRGDRNSPTVYMAAGHHKQFWDGREPDVEAQAKGPILNPVEMAMPRAEDVVAKLSAVPGYREAFAAAFPGETEPVSYDKLATAIGAFERGLVTPAPWDRFVAGERGALTTQQKRGFLTFREIGCQTCHNGPLFGGTMDQKLGLVRAWPGLEDRGIGALTGDPARDAFFKVPSLRNVTRTGPYLHDGSVVALDTMVELMARHQLDRELTHRQVDDIVAFLGALEGKWDEDYIRIPELP